MTETTHSRITRGILPYAATILSISLAITLRVEHSCTGAPATTHDSSPTTPAGYAPLVASVRKLVP